MSEQEYALLRILDLFLRVAITCFCVYRAGKLDRSKLGWGIFGFMIPWVAFFVILFMKPKQAQAEPEVAAAPAPVQS